MSRNRSKSYPSLRTPDEDAITVNFKIRFGEGVRVVVDPVVTRCTLCLDVNLTSRERLIFECGAGDRMGCKGTLEVHPCDQDAALAAYRLGGWDALMVVVRGH